MSSNRIKHVGLDERWLIVALCTMVFFQFALDGGGSESAIWVAGLFLGLQALYGDCAIRSLPPRLLVLAGLGLLILVVSWSFSFEITDSHRSFRIMKFIIVAFSVYCLGRMASEEKIVRASAATAALVILWQFAIRHLDASPYGSFGRPHYLAYFSLLLVPPLAVLSLRLDKPYRYILPVLFLPAMDLILNDMSKPLIPLLSLAAAASVVLFFAVAAWRRWAAFLWLGLTLAAAAYLAPAAMDFFTRDERSRIWEDSLRMIAHGDWTSWAFGHGLGSFPAQFPEFSAPEYAYLSLPHNHFLEILFESGIALLVGVVAALVYLVFQSAKLAWIPSDKRLHQLALCNLAVLVAWFVFSFFAFSVYSTYSLYPLAIIIGVYFALAERLDVEQKEPVCARD